MDLQPVAAGFVLSLWMEHMADVPAPPPAPLNPFSEDWCFPGALSLEQKAGSVLLHLVRARVPMGKVCFVFLSPSQAHIPGWLVSEVWF